MKLKLAFNGVTSKKRLPKGISVQPRRPDVSSLKKLSKLWFGGNPLLTFSENVFSVFIPPGERFFIRSVRHFKDRIQDPELKELMRAFMQQETLHGKAHDAFNESFEQYGYRLKEEQEYVEKVFERIEKYVPAKFRLGMTVFFEHLTATGAAAAFYDENVMEMMSKEALEFWQWHAAEEIEHKAVAFDVLEEVSGNYFTRVSSAVLGLLVMTYPIIKTYRHMAAAYNEPVTEEHKKELKAFLASPYIKKQRDQLLSYFKPGFHPWQIDDEVYLKAWYEKYKMLNAA